MPGSELPTNDAEEAPSLSQVQVNNSRDIEIEDDAIDTLNLVDTRRPCGITSGEREEEWRLPVAKPSASVEGGSLRGQPQESVETAVSNDEVAADTAIDAPKAQPMLTATELALSNPLAEKEGAGKPRSEAEDSDDSEDMKTSERLGNWIAARRIHSGPVSCGAVWLGMVMRFVSCAPGSGHV